MKPFEDCALCIVKWIYERVSSSAKEEQKYALMRTIMDVLSHEFIPSGNVALISKRILDKVNEFVLAAEAHYSKIKMRTNHVVEGLLSASRDYIRKGETHPERFKRACSLACAGNVSPISAPTGAFVFPEVEKILEGKGPQYLLIGDVYRAVQRAGNVLFLTDNAGEIGFDSLLIEELKTMGLRVALVVKEDPFFEDATIGDARYFGLDKLVDAILTTRCVFIPGETTSFLEEAYRKSDVVIAKGVFNFESLSGEDLEKPTIHMLKIKCGPLSQRNNVDVGDLIIKIENA
jgi:uncharacterized protein with ATP-grasp and redox domains